MCILSLAFSRWFSSELPQGTFFEPYQILPQVTRVKIDSEGLYSSCFATKREDVKLDIHHE